MYPVTTCIGLALVVIWIRYLRGAPEITSSLSFNPRGARFGGSLWKGAAACLIHVDLLHLLHSVLGLWWIRAAESRSISGSILAYLCQTLAFIAVSRCFQVVTLGWLGMYGVGDSKSAGFGAPIMGWMVYIALENKMPSVRLSWQLPMRVISSPLIYALLGQIFTRRQSTTIDMVGGMIGGVMASLGTFAFLQREYWTYSFLLWVYLVIGFSLKKDMPALAIPLIDYAKAIRRHSNTGVTVRLLDWNQQSIFAEYAVDGAA